MIVTAESRHKAASVQKRSYQWVILCLISTLTSVALLLHSFVVDAWFAGRADSCDLECAHCINWNMDKCQRWNGLAISRE